MGSLAPVREELLRGDYRSLYLGWLLSIQSGEAEEDDDEPPVPPGLQTLSAAQTALVEFMHLDEDLLEFAASASAPLKSAPDNVNKIVEALSAGEKDELLVRFLRGDDPHLATKVRRKISPPSEAVATQTGRTAGELLARGESLRSGREAEERRREEEFARGTRG